MEEIQRLISAESNSASLIPIRQYAHYTNRSAIPTNVSEQWPRHDRFSVKPHRIVDARPAMERLEALPNKGPKKFKKLTETQMFKIIGVCLLIWRLFYLIILVTYRILKVKVFRYNRYVNIACIYREKRSKNY